MTIIFLGKYISLITILRCNHNLSPFHECDIPHYTIFTGFVLTYFSFIAIVLSGFFSIYWARLSLWYILSLICMKKKHMHVWHVGLLLSPLVSHGKCFISKGNWRGNYVMIHVSPYLVEVIKSDFTQINVFAKKKKHILCNSSVF